MARRLVRGRGLVERPNWRIEGPNGLCVPQVDENGLLIEDFLLVTRVRSYLSTAAVDEGHFILSFGGTHGTGTRALELLYRDEAVLRRIAEQLRKGPQSFQLLFRASKIKHDEVQDSYARRIDLAEDVVVLPDQASVWQTANQLAERSLGDLRGN